MSNWKWLEEHRVTKPSRYVPEHYCSDSSFGFNGMFRFTLDGHNIRCIASDGMGWQHVSVTLEHEHKALFWHPQDAVIQIHPPQKEYVNYHEHCLHLWRCTDGREQPLPPSICVGPKALAAI